MRTLRILNEIEVHLGNYLLTVTLINIGVGIATGIVAYSMIVAGFVMLGAKLVQRLGAVQVFRVAVIVFGCAQVLMTFGPSAVTMIIAQASSGVAST